MAKKMKSPLKQLTYRNLAKSSPAQTIFFKNKNDLTLKVVDKKVSAKKIIQKKDERLLGERFFDLNELEKMTDSELIVFIHTKNREAYKELFARYQKKLFSYIYHLVGSREETEDILQNVFSKTYKNIDHFDVSRKFSSWIYRIAHNESVNFLKRNGKRYSISWEDVSTSKDKLNSACDDESPCEKMEHQEIISAVDWALEKIPENYQQVLKLRYFQECSYEEMSKILKKPVNTVGTLINRAKRKLLEVVDEQHHLDVPKH